MAHLRRSCSCRLLPLALMVLAAATSMCRGRELVEKMETAADDFSFKIPASTTPWPGKCNDTQDKCDMLVLIVASYGRHDRLYQMRNTWLDGVPHLFVSTQDDDELGAIGVKHRRHRVRSVAALQVAASTKLGQFKWLLVGGSETYFVLSNVLPLLENLDSSVPYFLGVQPKNSTYSRRPQEGYCTLESPQPCEIDLQGSTWPPYWPSFRAGFILSEGLVRAIGADGFEACLTHLAGEEPSWLGRNKELESVEVALCINRNGFGMTMTKPGEFNDVPFDYDPLHPPILSPWKRPLSFHAETEHMMHDIYGYEKAELGPEEPVPACFRDDLPPFIWEYNNFRGIGDRIIDLLGAWSVAWVQCRRIWIPWRGRTDGLPAWEDVFMNNLEGARVLTTRDYKSFERRLELVLPSSDYVSFYGIGSGRAFPETLYARFRLHVHGVSWRQFQLTYQMLALKLVPVPKVRAHLNSYREKIVGSIGLHLRRGDKVNAKWPGPWTLTAEQLQVLDEKTHAFIADLLQEFPGATFFVATDSLYAEEDYGSFIRERGGKVVSVPKQFGGGLDHGVSGASDDLELLSICAGILQSCTVSSFSGVASFLGHRPLLNLLPDNDYFKEGPRNPNAPFLYDFALPYEHRQVWIERVKPNLRLG